MGMVAEGRMYVDRTDAGFELGKLLEKEYKDRNVLVLGIPRGGIIIACQVANILNAELSVVVTKKLPHPQHHDLAIGAVAEDGSSFLTSSAAEIDRQAIQRIHETQLKEINNRVQRFRNGKPLPDMFHRTVIIVDDGIATGSTIVPAIKLCKSRKAARVIVASPVSGRRYVSEINTLADEVVIAEQPDKFYSVGQVYKDFHNLSDKEVIDQLDKFKSSYRKRN
jgi:putative phosphoribosyl transferase